MKDLLAGKVVLVTGAGGSIGFDIALSCMRAGATVIGSGLSEKPYPDFEGQDLHYVKCDVSKSDEVERVVNSIWEEYGSLDIVVNVAGVTVRKPFLEITDEDWEKVFAVNVNGAFFTTRAMAKRLVAKGRKGNVVNISSINSEFAHPVTVPYAATKGALQTLTYATAVALGPYGIRVNAIAPGTIETKLNAERWKVPGARETSVSRTPLGRNGLSSDVGNSVVFLASDVSPFTTGAVLHIDGGKLHQA